MLNLPELRRDCTPAEVEVDDDRHPPAEATIYEPSDRLDAVLAMLAVV